jgi:hypothetical protein
MPKDVSTGKSSMRKLFAAIELVQDLAPRCYPTGPQRSRNFRRLIRTAIEIIVLASELRANRR